MMYYYSTMKRLLPASILSILLFTFCVSAPDPVVQDSPPLATESSEETQEPEPLISEQEDNPDLEEFDPLSISEEVYHNTKLEVQELIEKLNLIIRSRNFNSWVAFLSQEYMESLSDPEYLDMISESPILKKQNIKLRSLRDFFIHVVVPARANDRVDDIEFIGQNRVKAYTLSARGVRLRLYDLEKTDGTWKISN